MKEVKNQEHFLLMRKLRLLAPLVCVLFLILAFYALGGGKGTDGAGADGMVKGVNMSLPLAHLDAKAAGADKMAIYKQASRDSAKYWERIKADPYAAHRAALDSTSTSLSGVQPLVASQVAANRQADSVLRRLSEMKRLIASPTRSVAALPPVETSAGVAAERAERLRRVLAVSGVKVKPADDPGMEKLDGMLDKLLRIQHPGAKEGALAPGEHFNAAIVEAAPRESAVGNLGMSGGEPTGFMEIGDGTGVDSSGHGKEAALQAMVEGEQTLTAGSTVGLRLVEEAVVNGQRVPAGQMLYGLASLSGERLTVTVSSMRVGSAIVAVSLQVFDLDGLVGIRIPGALTRDVAKESASEAIGGVGVSVDPSLGGQAANAGLQLARSLASRKVRLVRVSLPAGYRVLLKNVKR